MGKLGFDIETALQYDPMPHDKLAYLIQLSYNESEHNGRKQEQRRLHT